jgi:hypothetical protein
VSITANITQYAKTAGTLSGVGNFPKANRRNADGSLRYQYLKDETQAYIQEMGQYASNVYTADCQGLNPDDFFEWKRVQLRSVRAAQAQTGSTMPGDWQRIHIINPANYTYLPQGALLKYADNTWIVFKDKNISAFQGQAIVRRCNAVVKVLDWYGNIIPVPISYAKMETLGNAPHTTENTITSKNYIAVICQLNEYTESFTENTRILLGKTAYALRGIDDFTREFTDDPDSVHLLTFTIERVEVQPHDNVKLGVADYGGFSWEIATNWNNSMKVGQTQTLSVSSQRNNVAVSFSDEHPISYEYESTDESVLTVDENGVVTAVGEGEADIIVTLAQNPSITQIAHIEVPAAEAAYVAFTSTIPAKMHEYDAITVSAAYFENGEATDEAVTITFSGPEDGAYSANPGGEPNTYGLISYHASQRPLTITANHGEHSATAQIYLVT